LAWGTFEKAAFNGYIIDLFSGIKFTAPDAAYSSRQRTPRPKGYADCCPSGGPCLL